MSLRYRQSSSFSTLEMLTKDTYTQIQIFFKLASKITCIPIKYNEKRQVFEEISGKVKAWYFFMTTLTTFRSCYHVFWLMWSVVYGFPNVADISVEIFYFLGHSLANFLNIGAYVSRTSLTNYLNQLLKINRIFKSELLLAESKSGGRHPLTGLRYSDGCSLFMKLMTPGSFSSSISFGILFLLQPTKRLYYYHFIPGERPLWTTILYFLWESFTYFWCGFAIYQFWYMLLLYGQSCGFWLNQIR